MAKHTEMSEDCLTLRNGRLAISFTRNADGSGDCRPEWIRLGERPMLRFKDHEFLNIGSARISGSSVVEERDGGLRFAGESRFAGVRVGWSVSVCMPADGGPGFTVRTELLPLQEPLELLEALTTFELPYEYDGSEHQMTVMPQQPVYKFAGDEELSGAGFRNPLWYYGRAGRAHLTCPSAAPVMLCRVAAADGGNERCTTIIGNWAVCSVKDMFAQPTRSIEGQRGRKFLVGAFNWNASLHKDPNLLVEPGIGLRQELTIDVAERLPGGRWDAWLAAAWERCCRLHLPADGYVPALAVARSRGASWQAAARWLSAQFEKPEGCPGFFHPERGPSVYAPDTRPKWDNGVRTFAGQWTGPLAYLGHVWRDPAISAAAERVETMFLADTAPDPEQVGTIGPTPFFCAVLRKAGVSGIAAATEERTRDYLARRCRALLDPPAGARHGDPGILAWDAYANLLAADHLDDANCAAAGRELLSRVNRALDDRWWSFNCAAEGDLVGAGQGRPFGHGIAAAANLLAWQRSGDETYRLAAERLGNITMGLHFMTCNGSPAADLDTRGWAHGSTGGRDQTAQMPPWESGFALQQLIHLIDAGLGRDGFFDLLWLFAHTGLGQFPAARTMKRLYTADMGIVYRPIDGIASERAFYLRLPYLAYENPWDQTMLACYQGVEPIMLCLCLGGGLVAATDDRILALVPQAVRYDCELDHAFKVLLWNPLETSVETQLRVTAAGIQGRPWRCPGATAAELCPESSITPSITVPPRRAIEMICHADVGS